MAIVWLVDDDPALIDMVRAALCVQGHEIRTFATAADAVIAISAPDCPLPGVIITDLMMPGMDGYTFHAELQKDQRTKSIPLVVMTAKGKTRGLFEQSPNIHRFIEKPFDLDAVRDAVRVILGGK